MSYLAGVARETGWSDKFILWELPFAKGLGILHAAGIYNGLTMKFAKTRVEPGAGDSFREKFARMKSKLENDSPVFG